MVSTVPIGAILLIMIAAIIVGGIVVWLHGRRTFSGYEEISRDARQIQRALGGEIFRDGNDLVVSGNYSNLPVVARFSYSEYAAGLAIQMKAPATFSLSIVPKGERSTEGRVLVRTPDEMFDARFTTRSDHPTQAKMFLGKAVMAQLQKVMCSNKTFFTVSTGEMELSEAVIPANAGRHVGEHLKQLGALAAAVKEMPGAETIKIRVLKREGRTLARAVIAMGLVAVAVTLVTAMRPAKPAEEEVIDTTPAGILPVDAVLIPRLPGYHLAVEADFTPQATAWLEDKNLSPNGRVTGDFCGQDNKRDVAYLLVAPNGERRVVFLVDGVNTYDATFPTVDMVLRVPRSSFKNIQFAGKGIPKVPDGDLVLVVRDLNDRQSGVLFYVSNKQLASAVPQNYQSVNLGR